MQYMSSSRGIKDSSGDAITFAIAMDEQFYAVFRDPSTQAGWTRVSLSAPLGDGFKARCFAATQNRKGQIFLAIAGKDGTGKNALFVAAALPPEASTWQSFSGRWNRRLASHPEIEVGYITMGTDDDKRGTEPLIVVGTTERAGKTPKFYRLADNDTVAWFPEMQNADQVLDVRVGARRQARGVYSLYRVGTKYALDFTGIPDPEYHVTVLTTLDVPEGAIQLDPQYGEAGSTATDLYVNGNGRFLFRSDNQKSHARATKVADEAPTDPRLTVRSSFTEEYGIDPKTKAFGPYKAYRAIITCPADVSVVDVWAQPGTDALTLEAQGRVCTIDAVTPVRLRPSMSRRIVLTIPATGFGAPALHLRTNLMRFDERHVVLLDTELHQRLLAMPEGALYESRDMLGVDPKFGKSDCDQVQKTMQSMAKTIQYTYNRTPYGVHHDRAVLPANMNDTHFSLDFRAGGGVQYQALSKTQVAAQIAGARLVTGQAGQGLWDDLVKALEDAEKVVVHTAEKIGHDIVETGERVGHDVVKTVNRIGEDLVHGDLWAVPGHFIQGGENIGRDLVSGAMNVGGDLVKGAGQLVMITLHLAGKVVQYVLDHTGIVGKVIQSLLQKIGATLERALDWLLEKIGWEDVIHTHDVILSHINGGLDRMTLEVGSWKEQSNTFFGDLAKRVRIDLDAAVKQLGGRPLGERPSPSPAFSFAAEKLEWLLSKMLDRSPAMAIAGGGGAILEESSPEIQRLLNTVKTHLGEDGNLILAAFEDGLQSIQDALSNPVQAPQLLLVAVIKLAEAITIAALDAVAAIADALFDLLIGAIELLKSAFSTTINIPFVSSFYAHVMHGRPLTIASLISLAVALPATLLSKAAGHGAPFAGHSVVAAQVTVTPPPEDVRGWGYVYASSRMLQSIVQVANDVRNGIQANAEPLASDTDIEMQPYARPAPNTPAARSKFDWETTLNCADVVGGLIAQISGGPMGVPMWPRGSEAILPHQVFNPNDKDDPAKAPTYWGHVIWYFQWAGWGVNALGTVGIRVVKKRVTEEKAAIVADALAGFNSVWAVPHMALMSVLDVADRDKRSTLTSLEQNGWTRTDGKPIEPKEKEEYERYLKWARTEQAIERKGFGNVISTFAELGKAASISHAVKASEGLSLIATVGCDVLGLFGESITVFDRIGRDELV